jgi:hypothetical protein
MNVWTAHWVLRFIKNSSQHENTYRILCVSYDEDDLPQPGQPGKRERERQE